MTGATRAVIGVIGNDDATTKEEQRTYSIFRRRFLFSSALSDRCSCLSFLASY